MTTNDCDDIVLDIDEQYEHFKISPGLMLGYFFAQYQDNLRTKFEFYPEQYQVCRQEFIKKMKHVFLNEFYENLRNVFSKGEINGENLIKINNETLLPKHPPIETDNIIFPLLKTIEVELDKMIDLLMPSNPTCNTTGEKDI